MKEKTHDEYIKEINIKNHNLEVIETYKSAILPIMHRCKVCGKEFLARPNNILRGYGCPVCAVPPREIGPAPEYKNSIWASEYRNIAEYYGLTKEQMTTLMPGSDKKIDVACINCGYKKSISLHNLFKKGFVCRRCSDGISYPEKFMASFLDQLKIDYQTQYSPDWAGNKRYDFYLSDYNCIIETHGEQHYKQSYTNRSVQDEQLNDRLKYKQAIENGIEHYIIIDCRESNMNWIKENILTSDIISILKFNENEINWAKCNIDSLSSKIKIASDLWNLGLTSTEIVMSMHFNRHTVHKWLLKAAECKMCDYTVKLSYDRCHSEKWRKNIEKSRKRKKVLCIETGCIYCSQLDVQRKTGILNGNISKSVRSNGKISAGGYHFVEMIPDIEVK